MKTRLYRLLELIWDPSATLNWVAAPPSDAKPARHPAPLAPITWLADQLASSPLPTSHRHMPFDHDVVVPGLVGDQRAYNAGMARHRGQNVMVFRLETPGSRLGHNNQIGAIGLDEHFHARGQFSLLKTPHIPHTLHTAEDPRAFEHQGRLMVIFNLSDNGQIGGPRQMHLGEVTMRVGKEGLRFDMAATWRLCFTAPGRGVQPVEKNWSPFSYDNRIHFLYRVNPNQVLALTDDPREHASGTTLYPPLIQRLSDVTFNWPAGECRGGTPAVYDRGLNRFVTFFHSSRVDRAFVGASGHPSLTYYFGCATFVPQPPFDIDQASAEPIAIQGMVRELLREGEGYGKRILFVQGLVADGHRFVLSYGRGDHHIGVCSLDRRQVIAGLRPARLSG